MRRLLCAVIVAVVGGGGIALAGEWYDELGSRATSVKDGMRREQVLAVMGVGPWSYVARTQGSRRASVWSYPTGSRSWTRLTFIDDRLVGRTQVPGFAYERQANTPISSEQKPRFDRITRVTLGTERQYIPLNDLTLRLTPDEVRVQRAANAADGADLRTIDLRNSVAIECPEEGSFDEILIFDVGSQSIACVMKAGSVTAISTAVKPRLTGAMQAEFAPAPPPANYAACLKGLSTCDMSPLTSEQRAVVDGAARGRNLSSCLESDDRCDFGYLTAEQKSQLPLLRQQYRASKSDQERAAEENYRNCRDARKGCDESLLNLEQSAALLQLREQKAAEAKATSIRRKETAKKIVKGTLAAAAIAGGAYLLYKELEKGGGGGHASPATGHARGYAGELLLFGGHNHEVFLGCITCSEFASDSVFNEFGRYGSKFSQTSIVNEFSPYGSKYNSYGACNDVASDPPVVVDRNRNAYGRLTMNSAMYQFRDERILAWLTGVCASH